MFASSGERTAPTQLATWRSVAARRGDRVTDGDIVLLAADEDFAHDEAQDALLLVHGELVEAVGEAGEEALERLGEFEVGLGVVQFGLEGGELRGVRCGRLRVGARSRLGRARAARSGA